MFLCCPPSLFWVARGYYRLRVPSQDDQTPIAQGAPFPTRPQEQSRRSARGREVGVRGERGVRGRAGEVVQNDPCNAKAPSPARHRGPCLSLARSPADSLEKSGSQPAERGKWKFATPVPTPITSTNPDARSAGDLTRAKPCQPQSAPSPSAPAVPGAARHGSSNSLRPGCAHPSNCREAPCTAAGQRGGRVTGKKAEQAASEALTAVRKAPPPLL